MELVIADGIFQWPALLQNHYGQRNRGNTLHPGPGKHVNRIHGAEPARISRQQPVKDSDGEGQSENWDEYHGIGSQFLMQDQAAFRKRILLTRGAAKHPGEY